MNAKVKPIPANVYNNLSILSEEDLLTEIELVEKEMGTHKPAAKKRKTAETNEEAAQTAAAKQRWKLITGQKSLSPEATSKPRSTMKRN